METETQKIELDALIELLDDKYSLFYVHYNDDFCDNLEMIQETIHGNPEKLDEMFLNWDNYETEKYILDELQNRIEEKFSLDEYEAKELIEENRDDLRYAIEERDDSEPLKDLCRNTQEQVFFYDTGIETEGYTGDTKADLRKVKKALKIPAKDKTFDDNLKEMLDNASYGGQLVVYFYDDLYDWIKVGQGWTEKENLNTIKFSGKVHVAVINTGNGSGHDTTISHTFTLPFAKENLFLCKTIKYSYTYEVCGMFSKWCESTEAELIHTKARKQPEKSAINNHLEREKQLNETFKAGGCTFGDMDINRHRNTPYRNEFPCGNKCDKCGTFWID